MNRSFFTLIVSTSLIGFALRAYGLSSQPLTGDDILVGLSAVNYMERGHLGPTMWNHPGLRNILVYMSMDLFGSGAWGLKSMSLFLGSLSVPLVGLVARRLFGRVDMAVLAMLFMAVDPLHIDYSRQAVHEVYMAFFSLAGIYAAMRFMEDDRPFALILSGISFGLGLASKWYVVFPLLVTLAALIYKTATGPRSVSDRFAGMLFAASALLLIPLTVYMATFIPWFRRGYDIEEWLFLQKAMYTESVTHMGYSPYSQELDRKAYLWFMKPVAYVDLALGGGRPTFLVGISNPFVWLLTIPCMLYILLKGIRERLFDYLYLSGLFWFSYIPFLFTSRPIWAHTAFSVIPFAFMGISCALFGVLKGKRRQEAILVVYLIAVIGAAIPLYLLATGKGYEITFLRPVVEMYRPSENVIQMYMPGNQ